MNLGEEAKEKWRNLKDGYRNAFKRQEKLVNKSRQHRKNFKPWKYISEMEFLKDIIKDNSPTDSNISTPTPTTCTAAPQRTLIVNSDDEEENEENEGTDNNL